MEDSRKKTYIADIERGVYDIKDEMHHKFTTGKGLTEEIVRKISEKKNEPQWMLEYRLKALEVFNSKPVPTWGPDLSDLDINDIVHYLEPDAKVMSDNWDDVPDYIKLLTDLEYLKLKDNRLQEWEPSMTRKLFTTVFIRNLQIRE